jgi:glycosyltransferase involved in cell wall biosynthesis
MHVVFLSTNQTKGGAAIAANRYFDAYCSAGGEATYASKSVQKPGKGIVSLKHAYFVRKIVKYLFKNEKRKVGKHKIPGEGYWSAPVAPRFHLNQIKKLKPDLVCINWINDDFLSIGEIGQFDVPVVWAFHDLWAVTGGCHYPGSCTGFYSSCGNCPKLKYPAEHDWSRNIWQKKYEQWRDLDMTILCPSNWMASQVKKSWLFGDKRIEVCPYSIELDVFKPMESADLRTELGVKPHQKVLLFGAVNSMHDTRKGAHLLVEALEKLEGRVDSDDLVFMVFGAKESPALEKVPFRIINLGFVGEKADLARYYAASTAFVLPSLEDNLPNTVLESLACGSPVVAFDIGGISDMIDDGENGFLVDRINTSLLADALEAMVKMPEEQYQSMRKASRKKMEDHFSKEVVGQKLIEIFNSISTIVR